MVTMTFLAMWLSNQQAATAVKVCEWWTPCCEQREGGLLCKDGCRMSFETCTPEEQCTVTTFY